MLEGGYPFQHLLFVIFTCNQLPSANYIQLCIQYVFFYQKLLKLVIWIQYIDIFCNVQVISLRYLLSAI